MYKMGSNNAKSISSEGRSESVGPPSAKVIPEPVANPTTPSSTIVGTPVITPDNQSVLPAERKASLIAQKNIKHTLDEEESDNEELGDYHRVRHARKKCKTDGDEKIVIGHHCNEPRLRIFAKLELGGHPYIYATREDVIDPNVLRQWDDLVPRNSQVNTDKVILDKEIFSDLGDVEGLNKKKLDLIREYLASTSKKQDRSMKDSDSSLVNLSQKYSCHPPHLHVGYFKNDKEEVDHVERVPVQAKVVYSYRGPVVVAAVKFQVLEADGWSHFAFTYLESRMLSNRLSRHVSWLSTYTIKIYADNSAAKKGGIDFGGKRTLLYEQVMFLGEYLKDTEEKTRAHIKTHFTLKSEGTVPGQSDCNDKTDYANRILTT
jgi:hypothetical protein